MIPAAFGAALEALDRRLALKRLAPVVVGLSGGSDSLALLRIVTAWAGAARRPLLALTMDHGLHPDSAAWTQAAGEAARRLGAPWRALAWTGTKPSAGLPAAARHARHALLAEAARGAGACVLLLGHTADDVAESELIRVETPTHGRLAEWAPSPAWPEGRGVFLLRPLLALRRADLQAWLATERVSWLDDPANSDLRFARSRARASLTQETSHIPAPFSHMPPSSLGQAEDVAAALAAYGVLDLALGRIVTAERPVDALAKALLCVSGRTRAPAGAALTRLLTRLSGAPALTATLSGTRLRAAGGRLHLSRELGRSPPHAAPLARGVARVFDGRFEVVAQAAGWRVAPLAGHAAALPKSEREALRSAPAEARPSLPALIGPGGEVRLPHPLGAGPADARCLLGERLAAAWGWVSSEEDAEQARELHHARSAARALVLS